MQSLLLFVIGSKPSTDSSQPTGVDEIWKMRAIDGILEWKRCWSMDTSRGNEAALAIDHQSTSFPGASELKKLHSRLSKDEIAKFGTRDFEKKTK